MKLIPVQESLQGNWVVSKSLESQRPSYTGPVGQAVEGLEWMEMVKGGVVVELVPQEVEWIVKEWVW